MNRHTIVAAVLVAAATVAPQVSVPALMDQVPPRVVSTPAILPDPVDQIRAGQKPADIVVISAPEISTEDRLSIENAMLRANLARQELQLTPAYQAYERAMLEQGQRIQAIVAGFEKAHAGFTIDTSVTPMKAVVKKPK